MPRLLICSLALSVCSFTVVSTAEAQPRPQTPPRTAAAQSRMPATQGQAPRPAAQPMQVTPEMDAVLTLWERQSARLTKLTGTHRRTVYDTVSGVERRGGGKFWFESPDRGRLDLQPAKVSGSDASKMKMPTGQPYRIVADQQMMWICNGSEVLQIEEEQKGYYRTEIPPQLRGQNIVESPLPFLFGMKAADVKARYRVEFGKKNTFKPGTDPTGKVVHIRAYPTRRSDATNWSQADVYLDAKYFLPYQITLRDPAGTQMTQYQFDRPSLKANQSRWQLFGGDPFHPNLKKYKLLGEQKAKTTASVAR